MAKTRRRSPQSLEELLEIIQKKYGDKALAIAGDVEELYTVSFLPTGLPAVDEILGGGIPRGHITEFFGPWSGGKTFLALNAIAKTQADGGTTAFIDSEVSFSPGFAKVLGVDLDRLLISTPEFGEEALDIAISLIKQGVDLTILDSAVGLVPREELEKQVTISGFSPEVRLWNAGIKRIKSALALGKPAFLFCVAPGTHILTEDLRWVKAERLSVGDRVIGVDEKPGLGRGGKRRVRSGTITQHSLAEAELMQVVTDRGTIVVTANHPFLTIRPGETHTEWTQANELKLGQHIKFICGRWTEEDGDTWLAGISDGEGSVSVNSARSLQVRIVQNPGLVANHIADELDRRGMDVKIYRKFGRTTDACLLGTEDVMRFLGQVRPKRLLQRWAEIAEDGVGMPQSSTARVAYTKPLGRGPVVSFSTSIHTYIAEGFVSHNTNQVRDNIGVMYGPSTTEPMGHKSKHESVLRLEIRRKEFIKKGDQKVGHVALARVVKAKYDGAHPYAEATFDILYPTDGSPDGGGATPVVGAGSRGTGGGADNGR